MRPRVKCLWTPQCSCKETEKANKEISVWIDCSDRSGMKSCTQIDKIQRKVEKWDNLWIQLVASSAKECFCFSIGVAWGWSLPSRSGTISFVVMSINEVVVTYGNNWNTWASGHFAIFFPIMGGHITSPFSGSSSNAPEKNQILATNKKFHLLFMP